MKDKTTRIFVRQETFRFMINTQKITLRRNKSLFQFIKPFAATNILKKNADFMELNKTNVKCRDVVGGKTILVSRGAIIKVCLTSTTFK